MQNICHLICAKGSFVHLFIFPELKSLSATSQGDCYKLFQAYIYEGWNFNSGNYLFTTDTK